MGNILKVKSGNEWIDIPAIVGPQGAAGQDGATGATGPGVAAGGTTGQIQKKKSNTDYDTEWANDLNTDAVSDVQVNGSSVVSSGVANIQITGVPSGGSANQVQKKNSNNDGIEWGTVSSLPSGGSANQVLKKNSLNNDVEWAGYSVPAGGYYGQVLSKSSNANGMFTWNTVNSLPSAQYQEGYRTMLYSEDGYWHDGLIVDTVYEYEFGQLVNDIQYYQDDSGVDSQTFGLYLKFTNGDITRLCFAGYDNETGDIVYNYYNIDYVSEPDYDENYTNDTAYDSYGFPYIGEYYHDVFVSKCNADGSITRKVFRAIYEDYDYSSWVLFDISDQYDLSLGGDSGSNLPAGGTAGQFLKKTSNGEEWATINQVPDPSGQNYVYLYVDDNGDMRWHTNTVELGMDYNALTETTTFVIQDIDEIMDAYRYGQRVVIGLYDQQGNDDGNPYVMMGIHETNTNNDYTYLMQIGRLKADGTWDNRQFLFSFNTTHYRWEGVEQAMPAVSNAQSAVGVSF